jgi:hypothetical protein
MPKSKARILKLVPSGKRLTEVVHNLELESALSAAVLGALIDERPQFKGKVLAYLEQLMKTQRLTKHQQEIVRDAIGIVKMFRAG